MARSRSPGTAGQLQRNTQSNSQLGARSSSCSVPPSSHSCAPQLITPATVLEHIMLNDFLGALDEMRHLARTTRLAQYGTRHFFPFLKEFLKQALIGRAFYYEVFRGV